MSRSLQWLSQLLVLMLAACLSVAGAGSNRGTERIYWTLRKPSRARIIDNTVASYTKDVSDFGELKTISTFEVELDGVDMSLSDYIERVVLKDVVIRLKSSLLGWHSYEFVLDQGMEASTYTLISFAKSSRKRCQCVLYFEEDGEGNAVRVEVKFASRGISRNHEERIGKELATRIQSRAVETKKLITSRRRSLSNDSVARKQAVQKDRRRRIDKVLHPEKYRTKSPTVRKAGKGGSDAEIPQLARSQVYRGPAGTSSISRINANRRPARG